CQCLKLQFGIDARRLERAVPQDIRHVFEAGAVIDHLRGGRMPEEMAASPRARREACALPRLPDNPPDGPMGQGLKGGTTLQKDLAAVTRRATALQVGHQRL